MSRTNRTPTCPECRSSNVVPIMYGEPTEEGLEEARQGKHVLGGCCIRDDSPIWHCRDCEHNWGDVVPRGGR